MDKWEFGMGIFGLLALIVYTGYTIKMYKANAKAAQAAANAANTAYCALKDSEGQFDATLAQIESQTVAQQQAAKASADSAKVAQDTLIRSQRPWIGVAGNPTISDMDIQDLTLRFTLTFSIKNYGTSPAIHINMIPVPQFFHANSAQEFFGLLKETSEGVCHSIDSYSAKSKGLQYTPAGLQRIMEPAMGIAVFPQDTQTVKPFKTSAHADTPHALTVPMTITGCIGYQDQFSKAIVHHTRFCYQTRDAIIAIKGEETLMQCRISSDID